MDMDPLVGVVDRSAARLPNNISLEDPDDPMDTEGDVYEDETPFPSPLPDLSPLDPIVSLDTSLEPSNDLPDNHADPAPSTSSEESLNDIDEFPEVALPQLKELRDSVRFIEGLKNATLDASGLDQDVLDRLRNPPRELPHITPDNHLAISLYLETSSEESYNSICKAILVRHPRNDILTYY